MPGERGKGNSVACFHRRKLLYFPLSPYEAEAACKPSPAMHLLALLLSLSFHSSVPLSLLETGLAHLPSLGQPGLGQISGHRSPDLWSGHPCLGSYTHSQFNVLPTFPLKSRAHVCSWPCSQEMVMPSPGDTSNEPAGREGGPSAKQCAVRGSP